MIVVVVGILGLTQIRAGRILLDNADLATALVIGRYAFQTIGVRDHDAISRIVVLRVADIAKRVLRRQHAAHSVVGVGRCAAGWRDRRQQPARLVVDVSRQDLLAIQYTLAIAIDLLIGDRLLQHSPVVINCIHAGDPALVRCACPSNHLGFGRGRRGGQACQGMHASGILQRAGPFAEAVVPILNDVACRG
ncbi:hypothetical protein D3C85_476680 [compost metagenome]